MLKQVDLKNVSVTDGYLKKKQDMNVNVTIPATYEQFNKTGRIDAMAVNWREGMPNKPHIFWDSDVAKWIEGAAYTLIERRDENLESLIDSIVENMEVNQTFEGYYNSYYQTCELGNRFTNRNNHELYCAGHLLEGAIAYKQATGKDKMLNVMIKYIDYIDREFKQKERPDNFRTPGHEEIELALVRLYQETGERKYLELSEYFVNSRGKNEGEKKTFSHWASASYAQDHVPVSEQFTAEGHSVRCLYLFAGAADIARECGDEKLKNACVKLYENIVTKRMYVNGGIGGNYSGEAFSYDYDLPNELAYTETCASIAMMFFCQRMFLLTGEKRYMDTLELQFYNAVMSGVSSHGDRFFYCNPLEVHPDRKDYFKTIRNGQFTPEYERPEYFGCSCCPPNVVRLIASIGQYMYQYDDENNSIYVNLFGSSKVEFDDVIIEQETNYPYDGEVKFTITPKTEKEILISVRVPDWCKNFEGDYITVSSTKCSMLEMTFEMPVTEIYANPKVHYAAGKVAVRRGPIVFCAESIDNGENLQSVTIKKDAEYAVEKCMVAEDEAVKLTCDAYFVSGTADEPIYQASEYKAELKKLTLIPYALWANRGRSEMTVWIRKEMKF